MTPPIIPDGDKIALARIIETLTAPAHALADRAIAVRDQHLAALDTLSAALRREQGNVAELCDLLEFWQARARKAEAELVSLLARPNGKSKPKAKVKR